jgi:hypothetical protein
MEQSDVGHRLLVSKTMNCTFIRMPKPQVGCSQTEPRLPSLPQLKRKRSPQTSGGGGGGEESRPTAKRIRSEGEGGDDEDGDSLPPISLLSAEVLGLIFSWLPWSDLLRVEEVSHQWRIVAAGR